jgi:hypothetical protein
MSSPEHQSAKRLGESVSRTSVSFLPFYFLISLIYNCSWLYMLTVAMDANFRLKSRLRNTTKKELTLGMGWSYFVDNGPYSEFIKNYIDEEEVSVDWLSSIFADGCIDSDLRRFSGAPQHVNQKIKRAPCNRPGCCQLCSPSSLSAIRYGRSSKGRAVRRIFTFFLSLVDAHGGVVQAM